MKRRDFIAASALGLLSSPAFAAKKQAVKKTAARRTAAKPGGGSAGASQNAGAEPTPQPPQDAINALGLPEETPSQWRTYDVETRLNFPSPAAGVRLWLPLVQYRDTPWERSLGHRWQGNFSSAGIYRDPVADMEVFYADWAAGSPDPQLDFVSQVATQNRHFDVTRRNAMAERTDVLRNCIRSTRRVPNDGIVRQTAERAVGRIKDPLARAKAIYDWVVDHTRYDPGLGKLRDTHIGEWLESGDLRGRSADISLLFVGLCRSLGIPARPAFGLRLDHSGLFASLGTTGELRDAQHCRAEFYSPGYGWIAVNPADVRQAMHDEQLGDSDSRLAVLRKLLFGFWEMNWVSFNAALDVTLRGAASGTRPFLVTPALESADGQFDSGDAGRLVYSVSAQRVEG